MRATLVSNFGQLYESNFGIQVCPSRHTVNKSTACFWICSCEKETMGVNRYCPVVNAEGVAFLPYASVAICLVIALFSPLL